MLRETIQMPPVLPLCRHSRLKGSDADGFKDETVVQDYIIFPGK